MITPSERITITVNEDVRAAEQVPVKLDCRWWADEHTCKRCLVVVVALGYSGHTKSLGEGMIAQLALGSDQASGGSDK